MVLVYDGMGKTPKYDETNVAERHLTSLYVHNFDKDNAEEIQMRAIEKVEKRARLPAQHAQRASDGRRDPLGR